MRRELLVLRLRGKGAVLAGVANDARDEVEAHRRERTFPELAAAFTLADEAPFLRRDGTRIQSFRQMIDGTAGDGVAFAYGPLDRGDAPMARQQRRMIANPAQA